MENGGARRRGKYVANNCGSRRGSMNTPVTRERPCKSCLCPCTVSTECPTTTTTITTWRARKMRERTRNARSFPRLRDEASEIRGDPKGSENEEKSRIRLNTTRDTKTPGYDGTKHPMCTHRLCLAIIYICECKQIHGRHARDVKAHARAHVRPFNTFLSIAMHRPAVHVCTAERAQRRFPQMDRFLVERRARDDGRQIVVRAGLSAYMIDRPLFIAARFFSLLIARGIKPREADGAVAPRAKRATEKKIDRRDNVGNGESALGTMSRCCG